MLLAILRIRRGAYGVSIRREIEQCTGRKVAAGALYTTLTRLENKGFVSSSFGDPTPARGGRPKRYFSVTADGVGAVASAQRQFRGLLRGLDILAH